MSLPLCTLVHFVRGKVYKEEENPGKRHPNLGAAGKQSGDERVKPMTPACNEEGGVKRAGSVARGRGKLSLPIVHFDPTPFKDSDSRQIFNSVGSPP